MKSKTKLFQLRRVTAAVVLGSMLLQSVSPAYAVVSQLPSLYVTPPDVNVMFTLDDSGSMMSDAIPDFISDTVGMPKLANSNALGQANATFPGMWKSGSSYLATTYFKSTNAIARYMRSASGNPLYYDPKVTYLPWPTAADDTALNANANVKAVNIDDNDPFATAQTLNLTLRYPITDTGSDNEDNNFWLTTYYLYKGSTALPFATPNTPLNTAANFTKVEIKPGIPTYARDDARTDCSGAVGSTGCTYAEELQNFSNWLQYYRSRFLMAKGGVAQAFAKQGTNLRVGFGTINKTVQQGVSTFAGTRRTKFYSTLYAVGNNGSTPLRDAMDKVGKYFMTTGKNSPYAADPTVTQDPQYTCRKSFHIMSTDGFWNGGGASDPANKDNDSFSGKTPAKPDGTQYTYDAVPGAVEKDPLVGRFNSAPYKDGKVTYSDTLADVAAYYWATDLQTALENRIAPSSRDAAFWQHLTTFTVGLGINGTGNVKRTSDNSSVIPVADGASGPFKGMAGLPWLANDATRDALVSSKTALTWPQPIADAASTGDDLIHAALNGHGRYFSATDPVSLSTGLASALTEATDQPIDLTSVAADSPQVRVNNADGSGGSRLYQATFNPNRWYGRLYAFDQNDTTGAVSTVPSTESKANPDQKWEASNVMPDPARRNIYTYSGTTGSTFTWAGLTSTQQGYLMKPASPATPTATQIDLAKDRLDYLRGSDANEAANKGPLRDRSRYTLNGVVGGVLGDVVNGSPIKGPDAGGSYDKLSATSVASSYTTFRNGTRTDLLALSNTIFLSANDGMLHAFNLSDGVERFGYVPNAVFNVPRASTTGTAEQKLTMLTDPAYTHRFTVDGPPNLADAFIDTDSKGDQWKTVLVGSTGAGARAIFAMDVTNPVPGTTANDFGVSKIMWEFTESNATYGADMGYMPSYPHVALMRTSATATTWVAIFGNGYDSASGKAKLFILNLQTGVPIAAIDVNVGTATNKNGLSQPNFILNANREVQAIYAGDIKGNLWKFDTSSTNPASWGVALGGLPLFAGGANQPISVMPEITAHTDAAGGAIISFGTGKSFENEDTLTTTANVNLNTQSMYGIWDKPGTGNVTVTRTSLQKQSIVASAAPLPNFQTTSSVTLDNTKRGWYLDLGTGGERVNISPQQVGGVLFMVANKPSVDPCANGGSSKLFAFEPVSGNLPSFPVFDVNNDKTYDAGYNVVLLSNGVLTQPVFQLSATAKTTVQAGLTVAPFALFDRGQTSGSRSGGVELSKTSGDTTRGNIKTLCELIASAASSDTSVNTMGVQICPPKKTNARISWRQIK